MTWLTSSDAFFDEQAANKIPRSDYCPADSMVTGMDASSCANKPGKGAPIRANPPGVPANVDTMPDSHHVMEGKAVSACTTNVHTKTKTAARRRATIMWVFARSGSGCGGFR